MSASDRLAPIIDIAWGRMPASEIKELRAILDEVARLEESHAELLEALQYALPYLEACVPNPRNGINHDYSVDVNVVDRARAAIAKAKGGKQ